MKTIINLLIVISLITTACSCTETIVNSYYPPIIIDDNNILTNKTKELFSNFEFPTGIYPVLTTVSEIEPLHTGAYADDLFKEIGSKIQGRNDFNELGVMIVISNTPKLMQIRVGNRYKMYCNLAGATSGKDYYTLQQRTVDNGIDNTIQNILEFISTRIDELNSLSAIKQYRLKSAFLHLNNFIEYVGTPSENLYSRAFINPIMSFMAIAIGILKSWFLVILTVVLMLLAFYLGINKLIDKYVNIDPNIKHLIKGLVISFITIIISISTIASAVILSSGRMEDMIALQALGIPMLQDVVVNIDNYAVHPSVLLSIIFIMLFVIKHCLCSDLFLFNLYEPAIQKRIFKESGEFVKALTIIGYQSDLREVIDESDCPYTVLLIEKSIKKDLPICFFVAGAVFFILPKIIIVMWLAFICYSIIRKGPMIYDVIANKNLSQSIRTERQATLMIYAICIFIALIVITIVAFLSDPTPKKEEIDINKPQIVLFPISILEGGYTIEVDMNGNNCISSARIKQEYGDVYKMTIMTKGAPRIYTLYYDAENMTFYSREIGLGIINYDKEIDRIKILFNQNNNVRWELSK